MIIPIIKGIEMIKENKNNFAVEQADVFEEERYTSPCSSTKEVSIGLSIVKNGFPLTVGYIRIEANVIKMISSFYQREGYGSKLLKYAENRIRNDGYSCVFLTARPDIKGFYVKLGYREMTIWDNIRYQNCHNMIKHF